MAVSRSGASKRGKPGTAEALDPLQAIRKKTWCELSGLQHVQVDRAARKWGFPTTGPAVDLGGFLQFIYGWFAEHGPRLKRLLEDDGDDAAALSGPNSPSLERWRAARAAISELELEQRRLATFSRDEVQRGFAALAGGLRRGNELLVRRFGNDAAGIFSQALEAGMAALKRELGVTDDSAEGETTGGGTEAGR